MGYEDISGTRLFHTDYIGGTIAAASGELLLGGQGFVVWKPFTITGVALGAGTTRMAGATCSIKVWVNGARKGLAVLSLTHGAGGYVSESAALTFTGPANGRINLSVNSVGATAGTGARYQVRYHHGWSG
jgi:hypothetical protein